MGGMERADAESFTCSWDEYFVKNIHDNREKMVHCR